MSNFCSEACRPRSIIFEKVEMLDDYYGRHEYGVRFPDGKVYPDDKCTFKKEVPSEMPETLK
jgi:hypothetical protein